MDENNELLLHIYETAKMGSYTVTTLLNKIRNKENKLKFILEKEVKEYERFIKLTEKLLKKSEIIPKEPSIMSKIGSNIGIMKETVIDNSDSALSQMLIEGMTMGVTTIGAKISSYKKNVSRSILRIAKDFVSFQEEEIDRFKTFI